MAGRAHAELDVRVRTQKEMERIAETLHHPPCFDARTAVRYTGGFIRPPLDHRPEAARWFAVAADIWKEQTGADLAGANVGGASDGNFTAALAPTLDGLGAMGQGPHARHEQIQWSATEPRIALVRALVERAASQSRNGAMPHP
jgi:glutamate carboxypeptidase